MGQRYIALDGVRGVAAIFVVIYHMGAMDSPDYPLSSAYLAVDLFFGLSGFVLSHAYDSRLARGMTFSHFMARRLARLYPTYLVGLLLGIAAFFVTARQVLIDRFVIAAVTALLLIPLPVRLTTEPPIFPLDGPAWSLCLELVANAVFAVFFAKLNRYVLAAILLVSAAVLCLDVQTYGGLNIGWDLPNFWGGPPRASYSFFAGVLLHRLFPGGLKRGGLVVLSIALLALALPIPGPVHALYDLCFVLLLVPLTLAAGAGLQLGALPARIAQALGEISYPMYITHVPLVLMLKALVQDWSPAQTFVADAIALALLALTSWLLARFYEQPIKRYFQSYRAPTTTSLTQAI